MIKFPYHIVFSVLTLFFFMNSCSSSEHEVSPEDDREEAEETVEEAAPEVVETLEINPKVRTKCSKCGHGIAFYWTQQTRAADEPETRFFKCAKCNHTWREY